jgi:hypothetical protein
MNIHILRIAACLLILFGVAYRGAAHKQGQEPSWWGVTSEVLGMALLLLSYWHWQQA